MHDGDIIPSIAGPATRGAVVVSSVRGPTLAEETSERISGEVSGQTPVADARIYLAHLASYRHAMDYAHDREVLDFGCGTGYGAARLATCAKRVVGVDVAGDVVEHARRRFGCANVEYITIEPVEQRPLPFGDGSFDVVVSFQVIEHVADDCRYLEEAWRVLRRGGVLLLTTPNRQNRLFGFQKPWNPFHLREYSSSQLAELLRRRFARVEVQGMAARHGVLAHELRRVRRLKWLTLPFTVPIAPPRLRRWMLRKLMAIRRRAALVVQSSQPGDKAVLEEDGALVVAECASNSIYLLGVAHKDR